LSFVYSEDVTNLLLKLLQNVDGPFTLNAIGHSFNLAFDETPNLRDTLEKLVPISWWI
jgi:hypothetical protein